MPTYAIGDVQGCFDELDSLLSVIDFDRSRDRLWFTGDLVNRGPRSLDVLRFVRDLGEAGSTVLGNHDLHLLAASRGYKKLSKKDTLAAVLAAEDATELLDWLRRQPLLHEAGDVAMVHAGLPPQWSMDIARRCARELESVLRGERQIDTFLADMYGNTPKRWSAKLKGQPRLRYITNAFTRIRYVDANGSLNFDEKHEPGAHSEALTPWFKVKDRLSSTHKIIFGHWATLQLKRPVAPRHNVHHLDTGCVWGGTLTALRLDDGQIFSVPGWQGYKER